MKKGRSDKVQLVATYKIAGLIVRTLFKHNGIEQEFVGYSVPEMDAVDVIVEMVDRAHMQTPANLRTIRQDSFKDVSTDGESYCFSYKKNRRVVCSKLVPGAKYGPVTVMIYINDTTKLFDVPSLEVRFAIMHPFFVHLLSRGLFPLHSCGLSLQGKGILISGDSGSGKSSIGKILVNRYGATYLGDDVNACTTDGRVFAMPFSRVNNNIEAPVGAVIFLGTRAGRLRQEDVVRQLVESEFGMRWAHASEETAKAVAAYLATHTRCFMISRNDQLEGETAATVLELVFGKGMS